MSFGIPAAPRLIQPYPHYVGTQEVWFLEPERFEVRIDDLYEPLSRLPRYGGGFPVTDLQHLALCVYLARAESAFRVGLMALHDLHEACCIDVPSPMKAILPGYVEIEHPWMAHFHRSLGYPWPLEEEDAAFVRRVDAEAAAVEMEIVKHPNVKKQVELSGGKRPSTEALTYGFCCLRDHSNRVLWALVTAALEAGRP